MFNTGSSSKLTLQIRIDRCIRNWYRTFVKIMKQSTTTATATNEKTSISNHRRLTTVSIAFILFICFIIGSTIVLFRTGGGVSAWKQTVDEDMYFVTDQVVFPHLTLPPNPIPVRLSKSVESITNDSTDGSCFIVRDEYPSIRDAQPINSFAVLTFGERNEATNGQRCKVRANHCAYAHFNDADCIDKRNMNLCISEEKIDELKQRFPQWLVNLLVLKSCCQHYEFVLLVGWNMIIMDSNRILIGSLEQAARRAGKGIIVPGKESKKQVFNKDVIGMRCKSDSMKQFLEEALEKEISKQESMVGYYESHSTLKNNMLIVKPERILECVAQDGNCSDEDFMIQVGERGGLKYERMVVDYICESSIRSDAVDRIQNRICKYRRRGGN